MSSGSDILDVIRSMGACSPGQEWLSSVSSLKPRELWLCCPHADMMIYYARKIKVPQEYISLALDAIRSYRAKCRKSISPERLADIVREVIPYDVVRDARITYQRDIDHIAR